MPTPGDPVTVTKTFYRGTHRVLTPDETMARARPMLGTFGITRIANLTGLDRIGLPVVMVCRPNARSSAVFHGKGLDKMAATASGVMEAIETWHAEHVQLPLRLASADELRSFLRVIDLGGLPKVPGGSFHGDLRMLWVEGRELRQGHGVWVPFETVHMNSTLPEPPGSGCFLASTNGLASGNVHHEAVSHALCELIERDATSLWRQRPQAEKNRLRVDLDTITDGACRIVLDRLEQVELEVAVWDVTSDIGIPAFQCLVSDRTGEVPHLGQGAGCHPASEIALLRALTEAVQVRMTYIAGSREDIRHDDYRQSTLEQRGAGARALMQPVDAMRAYDATASYRFADLADEVAWIVERLASAGLDEAIVVDLSRPELGFAVVRAIVPGLEGSDHLAGYTPGARAAAMRRSSS